MASLTHFDISGENIPTDKKYDIDGKQYIFKFRENQGGFIEVFIYDLQKNFIHGAKLVYGENLLAFTDFTTKIVPLDKNTVEKGYGDDTITIDNLGSTVLLCTEYSE